MKKNKPFHPFSLTVLIVLSLSASQAFASTHWLRCGDVLDVASGELQGEHTIVVTDGRIDALNPGFPEVAGQAAADIEEIDLRGMTCLPGLMDMHTHLSSEYSPQAQVDRFTKEEVYLALVAA